MNRIVEKVIESADDPQTYWEVISRGETLPQYKASIRFDGGWAIVQFGVGGFSVYNSTEHYLLTYRIGIFRSLFVRRKIKKNIALKKKAARAKNEAVLLGLTEPQD